MLDDKKTNVAQAGLIAEAASSRFLVDKWKSGRLSQVEDVVAEEVPVALIYNGISHAVMLATPNNLEDFALGFSLAEGILSHPKELYGIEVVAQSDGIELRMEIAAERFHQLKEKRRSMTGRTGCGLCGAESLAQALRLPDAVNQSQETFSAAAILKALAEASKNQPLQAETGATHASFWVSPEGDVELVREDVGRHNALDKLLGAKARSDNKSGFVLTTSRASYEMVQKSAVAGVAMLVAISAPTGLAIRMAKQSGITLVGFARPEQYVVYTHPQRIG
jgi:FdhD protein